MKHAINDLYLKIVLLTGELELLMDRASDLCQFRINAVLKEMSEAQLCELPEDEPWTTEQFLKRTQVGEKTGSSVAL